MHPRQHRRADGAADQHSFLVRIGIINRLPAGPCDVLHCEPATRFRRPAVARQIKGDATVPGGHLRHLKDPARLVHRVRMHEGHDRTTFAHRLVIERSLDVVGHAAALWRAGRRRPRSDHNSIVSETELQGDRRLGGRHLRSVLPNRLAARQQSAFGWPLRGRH